jgi:hypothetical protein
MSGLMRFTSARTELTVTSISDEIDSDILNTIARHRLLSLLKSGVYGIPMTHRFGPSVA